MLERIDRMERRQFRTNVFKLMFQAEFREEDQIEEIISLYEEEQGITREKDQTALQERVLDMLKKRSELDTLIEQYSNGWKLERLGKAELAILRIAIYELLFDESVPDAVAINEAVELAKQYGDDKAPRFINGILGQLVKKKA